MNFGFPFKAEKENKIKSNRALQQRKEKKLNDNLRFLLEMGLQSSEEMGLSVFCR